MKFWERLNWYHIKQDISALSAKAYVNKKEILQLRRQICVLVIDDKEFDLLTPLQTCGFNIKQVNDIQDIRDLSAFEIVLCDIMGVGNAIDSKLQGASIIKQAKIAYPNKQVVAYTASKHDSDFTNALNHADSVMAKGASFDDWSSQLDAQIKQVISPQYQWASLRDSLFAANVSTIEVAKIESKYVEAFLNKDSSPLTKLVQEYAAETVGKIISDFLSSTVATIILGSVL